MQRMWRHLFAAVLGVLAINGIASAQYPVPAAMPGAVPARAAASPVVPASGAIYMRGSGGCSSCGTAAAPAGQAAPFAQYGPRDRNGCGSCGSDAAFMFGSCKSFFDPCGDATLGRGRLGGGCGSCGCPVHPIAKPFGWKYNGCNYDTHLNH